MVESAVDLLHYPIKSFRQHNSHEFLFLLSNQLHEDLGKEITPVHQIEKVINS